MFPVYIFSLVLGGLFLVVSLFGDVVDADADLDLDLDADASDLVDAGDAFDATDAADATHATKIFSIRGMIYALFGFGAVGSILTWLDMGGLWTLTAAAAGGLLAGAAITLLFNWVRSSDIGHRGGDAGFVGLRGRVAMTLGPTRPGEIVVERGARRVKLRALPHASTNSDPAGWESVFVIEMEEGIARVAPIDEDELALEP